MPKAAENGQKMQNKSSGNYQGTQCGRSQGASFASQDHFDLQELGFLSTAQEVEER